MEDDKPESITIWCLMDGKPGHQNQSLGLAEAIERQASARTVEIPLQGRTVGWRALFSTGTAQYRNLRKPDLILGAGHGTHAAMLALRRRYHGRTVVLMRPSLPTWCFDFCLIPEAHRLRSIPRNVVTTRGVLNRVVRSGEKDQHRGLILLGGPSQHYQWSDVSVMNQISDVIDRSPDLRWTIGTSRRTPASMTDHWERHGLNADLVLAQDAPRNWLLEQYAIAETIWVTDDSVSMTYEAVTSGSRVGLIELSPKQPSRVTAAIDALVHSSNAVRYSQWKIDGQMPTDVTPLAEADRCAKEVLRRLIFCEYG